MAIKLYDAMPSSNSDRVKIALHEKGLAYDRVTLNLAKKIKSGRSICASTLTVRCQ